MRSCNMSRRGNNGHWERAGSDPHVRRLQIDEITARSKSRSPVPTPPWRVNREPVQRLKSDKLNWTRLTHDYSNFATRSAHHCSNFDDSSLSAAKMSLSNPEPRVPHPRMHPQDRVPHPRTYPQDTRFDYRQQHRVIYCDGKCEAWYRKDSFNIDGCYVTSCPGADALTGSQARCAFQAQAYADGSWDATWLCCHCWRDKLNTEEGSDYTVEEVRFRLGIAQARAHEVERRQKRTQRYMTIDI